MDQHETRGLVLELEAAQTHSAQNYRSKHLKHKFSARNAYTEQRKVLTLCGVRDFVDPDQAVADLEHVIPE